MNADMQKWIYEHEDNIYLLGMLDDKECDLIYHGSGLHGWDENYFCMYEALICEELINEELQEQYKILIERLKEVTQ